MMSITEFAENLYNACRDVAGTITVEEAENDIRLFAEDGWELPEGLTAEALAEEWNRIVKEVQG